MSRDEWLLNKDGDRSNQASEALIVVGTAPVAANRDPGSDLDVLRHLSLASSVRRKFNRVPW